MKWLLAALLALGINAAHAVQQNKPEKNNKYVHQTQLLKRGSFQQIIAAHAGKPFIVAMWSLSCTHCGVDLEIFGRLANKYPQFDLVLISTDSPEQESGLQRTLVKYQLVPAAKRQGKVESWVFADSYTERLRFEIDSQWYGELPRTYFYDAGGKATAISGVLDEEKTEQWVRAKP